MKGQTEHKSLLMIEPLPVMPEVRPVLVEHGWKVEVCSSLLEASVQFARWPFPVVLIHEDALPEGSNPLEEIRQLYPGVIIVAMLNSPGQVAGAHGSLALPCDLRHIVRVLEDAYERQKERRLLDEIRGENERLRATVSDQSAQLTTLERASAQLGQASFRLQLLFKTALDLFSETAGAQRLSLMLVEDKDNEKELRIVQARGLSDEVLHRTCPKLGEGVAGWVAKQGLPLLRKRSASSPECTSDPKRYKSDCFLSLPLKVGDEVLGVVNMTERPEDRAFSEAEVRVLSVLSEQTALWISHCQELQQAKKLGLIDELTSLYNRRYFMNALKREIDRADRGAGHLSLAMLDIDYFKLYNDSCGHRAGDKLLKGFARVLQTNLRSTDIVCRYGGEEFTIILPETGKVSPYPRGDGVHFIDRLRVIVSQFPFEGRETLPGGRLTLSAGVALFPDDAKKPAELIEVADQMLYKAKRSGRNRLCSSGQVGNDAPQYKRA